MGDTNPNRFISLCTPSKVNRLIVWFQQSHHEAKCADSDGSSRSSGIQVLFPLLRDEPKYF